MNVKRFVAADMRRALELVKQEMGDDAIILSSKRTKAGVEILTSKHMPYEQARQASQVADTHSNYGAITKNLSPSLRSQLFGNGQVSDDNGYPNDTGQPDNHWAWENLPQTNILHERGPASGKTRRQLAEEIDMARRKMEAADQIPFNQQNAWQEQRKRQQAATQDRQYPMPNDYRGYEQEKREYPNPMLARPPQPVSPAPTAWDTQRIEPHVPNQIDEDLLWQFEQQQMARAKQTSPDRATMPTPVAQPVAPVASPPVQEHIQQPQPQSQTQTQPPQALPFTSITASYTWNAPQDLSHYLMQPDGLVAEEEDWEEEVEEDPEQELEEILEEDDEIEASIDTESDWQLQALKDEIADMREMLHVQLDRLGNTEPLQQKLPEKNNTVSLAAAIRATIGRRLTQMGLADSDIQHLLGHTKVRAGLSETWNDVLAALAHAIPICAAGSIAAEGVYAFVGPSGAGKTSIVSKLATKFVLANPRRQLSIIVLQQQSDKQSSLVRLGKILGIKVRLAHDRITLTRAIADAAEDDVVLIDTPSCVSKAKKNFACEVLNRLPQVEKVLVLPANAQAKSLRGVIDNYQSQGSKTCVLTKLDECASLGEVMSLLIQAQLPIAYLSQGQTIPDDMQTARGHRLVTMAVALLKKDQIITKAIKRAKTQFQSSQQSLSA